MVRAPSAFIIATLVAMLIAATATPCAAQDTVLIKPSFKVGDVWYFEHKEDSKQKVSGQQAPSGGASFEYSYAIGLRQEVKAVENSEAVLELAIDRIAIDMPIPMMGRFTYDTDIKEQQGTSGLSLMFDPIIGMKLTMRVDENLGVTAFDGVEAIIQKLQQSGRHPLLRQILGLFIKGRQSWGEEPLAMFANKDVKVGESWTKQLDVGAPGLGKIRMAYAFKLVRLSDKPDDAKAVVEFDVETSLDMPVQQSGLYANVETKMEDAVSHGSYRFDTRTGQIVEMNQQGSLTLRMTKMPTTEAAEPVETMRLEQSSKRSMRMLSPEQRERERLSSAATSQPVASTSIPAVATSQPAAPEPPPTAPTSQAATSSQS